MRLLPIMRTLCLSMLFLTCTGIYAAAGQTTKPTSLTVGAGFVDPVGFHDPSPVFSWKLPVADDVKSQKAYRVVVSESETPDAKVIWDSGRVDSDQSVWVAYEGPTLKSRQQVVWRVKFWDDRGSESDWSNDASIEMGLLEKSDWKASWIEFDRGEQKSDSLRIIKAEFGNRQAGRSKVKEVTNTLRGAHKRGKFPFPAIPRRLGGDPAPGEPKTLWIDFELNGSREQVEIPENKSFNPFPPITAQPAYYLRREFETSNKIVEARMHASALGLYEFRINGHRVGSDMLAPGYTMYSKRVETMTYDVTELVAQGDNAIGATLGEGWYAGNLLLRKRETLLSLTPKLLAQLELTYADGRVETIVSDDNWRVTADGPIRSGGYYHGEDYDASKELGDWGHAGYDDSSWAPVKVEKPVVDLVPKPMPPVQIMQQLEAVKLTQPEPGKYVFDFGQNQVGVPTITMPVTKGEVVLIRFAEMLKQDGTLYTENYRTARSQATYVAAETGTVTYTPSLSFFGYRYVELSGLAAGGELSRDSVVANVLHTAFESKGQFTSSDDKLNQLQSNIRWGQLSNFIDIPTDCPQRDERLGWTGDAQVFCPTSLFNYDVHSFWTRWLQSVRDEQNDKGEIPHTVPSTPFGYASPGWADVIVTAPWEVYVRTGDIRVLHDNYDAMQKWVGVYERRSKDFIPDLTGWGDWLQPYTESGNKGDTAQDLIATAYFGRDARIMHLAATALGKADDSARYKKLHDSIRTAFTAKYFPGGVAAPGAQTQTACLMGLGYDLVEPSLRPAVEKHLFAELDEAERHLRTGFLGTPLLAPVFDELGHGDISYELLFKESYPSWFFSINQGATTMWERWNSFSHADGFGDAGMNSYNHYAYGAIGQFMYERIAGLAPDPKHPGYKHFYVRPLIGDPLDHASVTFQTPYGTARSGWKRTDDGFIIEATVPPNATATAVLPTDQIDQVRFNGHPLQAELAKVDQREISIKLTPGIHRFVLKAEKIAAEDASGLDAIDLPVGRRKVLTLVPGQELDFEFKDLNARGKWARDLAVPSGRFFRMEADQRFSDPENMRLRIPVEQSIRQGDVILVSYWIRRPQAGGQPNNVYLSITGASEQVVYQNRLSAYRQWKQHVRSFVAEGAVALSDEGVRFDLGEAGTIVDIADLQLINFGPDCDLSALPRSTVMYAGREKDAAWRAVANARIDKIRKGELNIEVVDALGRPVPNAHVHVAMQKHAFGFGNAVNAEVLGAPQSDFPINPKKQIVVYWKDAQQYRKVVKNYFDRVTFESELRPHNWANLNSGHKVWNRRKSILMDRTLPWLKKNDIAARGHYLGWAPMDFNATEKEFIGKPKEHRKWLWNHMADVLPATNEFVNEWDTINHIVGWGKHTYEKECGGPDIYVEIMAEARRLAPQATHAINEGKVLPDGYKREPYKNIIRFLNEQGQAPDLVGFMGHFGLTSLTPPEELLEVYDEFAEIAPRLQLSEFDVDAGDDQQLQADYFRDVMIASFSHPNFEAIVQWGFWEKMHWKPSAALWREDWTLKPCGEAFVDLVANEWWTDETLTVDATGNCRLRGFLGRYKITATTEDGRTASVSSQVKKDGTSVRIQLR